MTQYNLKNPGGRPRNYTPEQVDDVIKALLVDGHPAEAITAKIVKPLLIEKFGVSDGIRDEALDKAVKQILQARGEAESRALLTGLPSTVAPAVDHVLAGVKQDLMMLLGRANGDCMKIADRECEELLTDKRNANFRIAELELALQDQIKNYEKLGTERDVLAAELSEAREELLAARAEIENRVREASTIDRLLAELRDPGVRGDLRTVLAEILSEPREAPVAS